MQVKTIERIIKTKLNNWLETIKDEGLRKSVKENLLLSGGAITSMFLNIEVNDYDIYINDMDVLLKLVQYYVPNCQDVSILDGRKKDRLIEKDTSERENSYSIALSTLHEDQIKLFFNSEKGGMRLNTDKKPEDLNYDVVFLSPNAISLSNNIQIVIRFHGDNEKIHSTFDYIHATNYFTFEKGLVTNKEALESILTKQLKYQGSYYPLTSIIRMKKFIKRGWNITAGEILKIIFQVSQLDLTDPGVLEEQLIGVDVAYFGKLIEILRGVPKEKMTSPYLNEIIDRVFSSEENEITEE